MLAHLDQRPYSARMGGAPMFLSRRSVSAHASFIISYKFITYVTCIYFWKTLIMPCNACQVIYSSSP